MNKTGKGIVARDSKGDLPKVWALQEQKRGEPLTKEALAGKGSTTDWTGSWMEKT